MTDSDEMQRLQGQLSEVRAELDTERARREKAEAELESLKQKSSEDGGFSTALTSDQIEGMIDARLAEFSITGDGVAGGPLQWIINSVGGPA